MALPNPNDFPRNSKYINRSNLNPANARANRPKEAPVVNRGSYTARKKTVGEEFKNAMFKKPAVDMRTYIIRDVVVPTIQNTILNYLMMVFSGNNPSKRKTTDILFNYGFDVMDYASRYVGRNRNYGSMRSTARDVIDSANLRDNMDYRDIVLLDIEDAKAIVAKMRDRINRYGEATVSDLYDLIGVTSTPNDYDWGWTNAGCIGIRVVPEGYLIDVADAQYLND